MSESEPEEKQEDAQISIQKWEAVFDSLSDLIFITDFNGTILRRNRAACEKLPPTSGQKSGGSVVELFPNALDPQTHELTCGRFSLLNGIYDLSIIPFELDGKIAGSLVVLKDVTSEKKYENDLRKTQRMASFGALAAGMAQEINSPLQVITGVGDGLLKQVKQGKFDQERFQKKLTQLSENAWKAAKILRSLLIYTQASADKLIPVDLNQLVRDSIFFIQNQITETEQVSFSTFPAANLPILVCDPAQITQAIVQLANNARDAVSGMEGTIIISTRYMEKEDVLVLKVEDNGCGIPQEMQTKIFEPFFSTKPVDEASGLGLTRVAEIVASHGGKIELTSTVGKGSAFSLIFPRRHNTRAAKDKPR
jgi:signal transduction histidine kinase